MMEMDVYGIYQTILTNFATSDDVYMGDSYTDACDKAVKAGFEAYILLDGSLITTYSPISGWRHFNFGPEEN